MECGKQYIKYCNGVVFINQSTTKLLGAAEARRAHNPEDARSKRAAARSLYIFFLHFFVRVGLDLNWLGLSREIFQFLTNYANQTRIHYSPTSTRMHAPFKPTAARAIHLSILRFFVCGRAIETCSIYNFVNTSCTFVRGTQQYPYQAPVQGF